MRMLGIAIPVVAALLLSGCLPTNPVVTPVPEASSTPVFASEDDALAAAEAAYAAYLVAADRVATTGEGRDALYALTTGDALQQEKDFSKEIIAKGWTARGSTSASNYVLQSVDQRADGIVDVRAYVCLDLSKIDYFDASGVLQTENRPDSSQVEVAFVNDGPGSESLLLSESVPWTGSSVC